MRIAFGVACVCSLIFFAGGYSISHPFIAGAIGGGASGVLGILFAHIQHGPQSGAMLDKTLTVDQLLQTAYPLNDEMSVYVAAGEPGIGPAKGIYMARIDNRQALIIERAEER